MEKYAYCTSKEWKSDINQLCDQCPLVDEIREGIKNQIIYESNEKKILLSENDFSDHIIEQIIIHKKAMARSRNIELQNKTYESDPYRSTRIKNYIHNKECIKALNDLINVSKVRSIAAKYYALYHWILIEMGKAKHFELNSMDQYNKKEIISFAEEKYKLIKGQSFYKAFLEIDITNKDLIAKSFGKGFKQKIKVISKNDAKVNTYLKKFPN